ncbi:MAG: BACON domain-containing carbohydrate-binding protein [Rikenellaceae bacterium]
MKKYNIFTQTLLWLFVACMSVITGCVKDEDLVATFDTSVMKYDAAAQNISYKISSNGEWTISSDQDWCTTSLSNGYGSATIDIILTYNGTSEERTATLSLVCDGKTSELTLIQSSQLCTLAVTPLSLSAGVASESFDIAVTSNTTWTAASENSWISLDGVTTKSSQLSYFGNGILQITVGENDTNKDRVGTISIYASSNDGSETLNSTVVISQSANSVATITLSTTSLNFDKEASTESTAKSVYFYGTATTLTATTDDSWCTATVSDDKITVSVDANATSASRYTIVTVTALVNGEEASKQVVISQEGTITPEIFLYNAAYNFTANSTGSTISWLNLTDTDIELVTRSTDTWVKRATEITNSSAIIELEANEDVESRSSILRLKYVDAAGNTCYKEIQLTQAGVGAPTIYCNDLSLSAAMTNGTLRIVVDNKAATFGSAMITSSWLTNSGGESSAGVYELNYVADDNLSDVSRENTVTVPVYVGNTTYYATVNVTQSGLGAPAISALSTVYVTSARSDDFSISLWLLGDDNTGVTFSNPTQSYTTTGDASNQTWIESYEIKEVDGKERLIIVYKENELSESRTAVFTIIATRGSSASTLDITLTQAGVASPGIVGLTQEEYFNYEEQKRELPFEVINNSAVKFVSAIPDDMFNNSLTQLATSNASPLTIGVTEFTGGETGSFREGVVTLKVTNSHEYPVYYDVLVRQTAPESPHIDAPSVVYLSYNAAKEVTIPINLINGAKIDQNSVTYNFDDGSTGADGWLTLTATEDELKYTVKEFNGSTAERRSVDVSFTVSNNNVDESMHCITFIQGEPQAVSSIVPETYIIPYGTTDRAESTYTFDIDVNGTDPVVSVDVIKGVDWLSTTNQNPTVSSGTAEISFTAEDNNAENGTRTGTIAVSVSGTNYKKETYFIEVIQGEAEMPSLDVNSVYTYSSGEKIVDVSPVYVPFSSPYKVTATTGSGSWITVGAVKAASATDYSGTVSLGLKAYDGSLGAYREGYITLTSENTEYFRTTVRSVAIRQLAPAESTIDLPQFIYLGYKKVESTALNYVLDAGNTLVSASVISTTGDDANWLTIATTEGVSREIKFSASYYEGGQGESRSAIVEVVSENAETTDRSTYYVTFIQNEPDVTDATVPNNVYIDSASEDRQFDANLGADGKISEVIIIDNAHGLLASEGSPSFSGSTITYHSTRNTTHSYRNAVLLVTTLGDNSYDKTYHYVTITQATEAASVITAPSIMSYGNKAQTGLTFPITTTNGGTVSAVSSEKWLTFTVNAGLSSTSDIKFDLAAYTTTDPNEYREAIITLTSEDVIAEEFPVMVKIRQYKDGEAFVTAPAVMSFGSAGIVATSIPMTDTGSTTTTVTAISTGDWLTVDDASDPKTYTVAANEDAYAREGLIAIEVENDNEERYTHYITVKQAGLANAEANVPTSVFAPYTGGNVQIDVTLDGDYTDAPVVAIVSDATRMIKGEPSFNGTSDPKNIKFTLNINTTASSRSATISLSVTGTNGETTIYFITITQGTLL